MPITVQRLCIWLIKINVFKNNSTLTKWPKTFEMTTSLFLLFVSNATASLNRYILRDKRQCCATKEDERNVKEFIRVPCCYCSFSFSKSACCDISHCCVSTKMLHLRQKKSWIRTTYRTNPLCCVERWNGGAADACRAIVHGVKQTTALLLKTWWWRKHQGVAQFKSPLRSEDNHRIFDEILFKWKIGRTAGSYRPV